MTEIIFAGIGGKQLSNNAPNCMQLNWLRIYVKLFLHDINYY
jgi:hypothetical protein